MCSFLRKGIAILLSVLLLCAFLPTVSAYVTTSGTLENVSWRLDSDGTLTISGSGEMPSRASAEYYPWYAHRTSVRNLVVESGITHIASYSFDNGYDYLENITLPNTVEFIGVASFEGCDGLKSVTIPGSVKELSLWSFAACSNLETVVIQEGVKGIGVDAFSDCKKLTSIVLPKSVEKIWQRAFQGCTGLRDITIMNPNCEIVEFYSENKTETIPNTATIHGYKGSTAETYAKQYNLTFVEISENNASTQTNDVLAMIVQVLQQMLAQFMNLIRQVIASSTASQSGTQTQTTAQTAQTANGTGDLSAILSGAMSGFASLLTGLISQSQG